MKTVIITIIVSLCIGLILGMLLGLFKKIFAVEADPKVSQIRDALSGGNCGGCGYAGCDAFAQAVADGQAPVTGCVAGGKATADKIAEIMGLTAVSTSRKVTILACQGKKDCAKDKAIYNGVKTCKAAQLSCGGTKSCSFGCIGMGDCVASCPFDALSMGKDGLPLVDYKKCTGCGKCVKECPKHLFTLVDTKTKGALALCSSKSENKPQIRKDCTSGCFKCGMCQRKCPENAIDISSGLPVIDYNKCTSCKTCITVCPDKVLTLIEDIIS